MSQHIRNIYRTQNGSVYVLNRESFSWELTELKYSDVDFYGNYTRISKEKAESIISKYRLKP